MSSVKECDNLHTEFTALFLQHCFLSSSSSASLTRSILQLSLQTPWEVLLLPAELGFKVIQIKLIDRHSFYSKHQIIYFFSIHTNNTHTHTHTLYYIHTRVFLRLTVLTETFPSSYLITFIHSLVYSPC